MLVFFKVAEAKSKLKDPGMVYSYHGGNRKRDPKKLAMNSVVVTTYETLVSWSYLGDGNLPMLRLIVVLLYSDERRQFPSQQVRKSRLLPTHRTDSLVAHHLRREP